MGKGHPIDRDKLHAYLFRKTDRYGRLRLVQKNLAEDMGVAHETICRVIKRMCDEKRMKRLDSKKNNVGVYMVLDPEDWEKRQKAFGG